MKTSIWIARISLVIGILVLPSLASAQAERNLSVAQGVDQPVAGSFAAPPTNVDDIVDLLNQYKPDPVAQKKWIAEANEQPPANASKKDLAIFYHRRGRAHSHLGHATQQIADLELAYKYAEKTQTSRVLGDINWIRTDLAIAHVLGGDIRRSIEMANLLISDNKEDNVWDRAWSAIGYGILVIVDTKLFDLNASRIAIKDAEKAYANFANTDPTLNYPYSAIGYIFEHLDHALMFDLEGNHGEAEARYRKAVEKTQTLVGQSTWPVAKLMFEPAFLEIGTFYMAILEDFLANNLRYQGRNLEAESYARSGLLRDLEGYGRYSHYTALNLYSLGRIVYESGRFSDAVALAQASIDSFEHAGVSTHSANLAEAKILLGDALLAQGRWTESAAVFAERDRELALDSQQYAIWNGENIAWGYALLRSGQPAPALAMIDRVYHKRLSWGYSTSELLTAQARGFYAMALAANGQPEKAFAEFQGAVPALLDSARRDTGSSATRQMFLAAILEAYMGLLVDMKESPVLKAAGIDAATEAFRIADIARGSAVQRALAESAARAIPADPALAAFARKVQDTEQRFGALSDVLNHLLSAPPEKQLSKVIADMKRDIESLREERLTLKQELEQRFPEYAELIAPKPVTLDQTQAALAEGEALVSIYVGSDRSYVWAIPKAGKSAFASVALSQDDISERVAHLRKALDIGSAGLEGVPMFDLAQSYDLYKRLLQPVEASWHGTKNLIIVPHKALGQLPFALLSTAPAELNVKGIKLFEGYRQVPWLIRQTAVTQLPSVSTLIALRRMPAAKPGRREFIGFGDPFFSKKMELEAVKVSSVSQDTSTRGFGHVRSWNITKVAGTNTTVRNSAGLAQLSRLEDTAEEINSIASVLKANPATDIFLGKAANEKNVLSGQLDNRRIVVFATHGLLPGDLNGLTQPALALSAPEVTGNPGENGLLTTDKVLGLKLNADWVVLSACNTASGDGAGSEAVSGLGRAFFFAGARTLLVSNWPVETVSAKLLTTKLFEHLVANPNASRAEALRETMLDLIDKTEARDFTYAHPMFWAPFSLVGDGGGN